MSKPILCFHIGYVPDINDSDNELCSSEISLINLADSLKDEYNIVIFGDLISNESIINGIAFLNSDKIEQFQEINQIDILILSRYIYSFLDVELNAKKTFLWIHDDYIMPYYQGVVLPNKAKELLKNLMNKIDGIITLSDIHKKDFVNFYNIDKHKVYVVSNELEIENQKKKWFKLFNQEIDTTDKIDLDFLEIGTSDVDTIIQECDDDTIGISVEPLKYYLDKLPNKKNVKKINKAITGDPINSKIKIYYIPFDTIINQNLPLFLRGCNKIGDYHPLHLEMNLQQYVKIEDVELINIGDFLMENNIRKIGHLKIDTEGYELNILKGLYNYISNLSYKYHPLEILFETNSTGEKFINDVNDMIELYRGINYELVYSNIIPRQCTDTLLKKINSND